MMCHALSGYKHVDYKPLSDPMRACRRVASSLVTSMSNMDHNVWFSLDDQCCVLYRTCATCNMAPHMQYVVHSTPSSWHGHHYV